MGSPPSLAGVAAVLGTAALLTLFSAGCGSESAGDGESVEQVVAGLQEDLARRDLAGVCAALAAKPRHQLGTIGHGRAPTTCERDLRSYLEGIRAAATMEGEPAPDLARLERPRIVAVDVSGDRAVATARLAGKPLELPFEREDGSWKLADLFVVTGPVREDLR